MKSMKSDLNASAEGYETPVKFFTKSTGGGN